MKNENNQSPLLSTLTLNAILLFYKPMTSLQILINYKVPLKLKSPQPNSIIRNLLIYNIPLLLISKQITKSLSRFSFSEPLGLLKDISDSMKSFPSLVHYCLHFIFQSSCVLSIQFSIYLYLNLLHPTLSLKEYN